MKINSKILSIPPYLSTSWKNIASLHVENQYPHLVLIVTLLNGTRIQVPHLELAMIESIFSAHAEHIEQELSQPKNPPRFPLNLPLGQDQIISLGFPLKAGLAGIEQLGSLLQHNPQQASHPDLPPEVIEKVAELSRTLGIEDTNILPKPEPHCNCLHCQVARALQAGLNGEKQETDEEIVSDEDLKFKTWDVAQSGEKLYVVTNPLDKKEHYNVYLGEPIGCTCGESQCEHIRAVLST